MSRFKIGPGVDCDLSRLVETRLLIQANSGGGKSWLLRRILEQTHGKVQQLVIDPEGEFSTLREKFDYVLAAKSGGDTAAHPRSAKLLAERLLELGVSAILDIYELKPHERIAFVQHFLEALVDAPKSLWHPALVVVDEAHVYCPQHGDAASAGAVVDLCTRGRKRGFCAVLATQRLAKLHKDAAAELNNKLIGRTGLDVDMKRAGDELGFTGKDQVLTLRQLPDGHFFAFGPAISLEVKQVHVGSVETHHPESGARVAFNAPPPSEKVRALLPKLADLPAEAEERAKTVQDLQRDLASARRELTVIKKAAPVVEKPVEKRVEVPILKDSQITRLEAIVERVAGAGTQLTEFGKDLVGAILKAKNGNGNGHHPLAATGRPRTVTAARAPLPPARSRPMDPIGDEAVSGVSQRILNALAELEVLGVERPERVQVAFLAGYTHLNSKGFTNGLGALNTSGMTVTDRGTVQLTEAGRAVAQFPDVPRSPEDVQQRVIRLLGGTSERILAPLIAAYPDSLDKQELAAAAGYGHLNSKGFTNAIGRLRSLGFIDYPERGRVAAQPVLFLEVK